MKFSNAALTALPLVAFIQLVLVSRTKAASTKGLTIADGMVADLCEGSNITVVNGPALSVGDFSSNGGASLTITGGSYKSIYNSGMEVNGGSVATVLGGMIQGGKYGDGMWVDRYGDGAVVTVLGGTIQGGLFGDGMDVYVGAVATVLGGMIQGGLYRGMRVYGNGAVATVLGGTIQGGLYGDGMAVYEGAVATVCDGAIQGATGWYNHGGVSVNDKATVRIAGGIIIGGNSTSTASEFPGISGYGFYNYYGDATITGGTFKGGFNSTPGDQAPSLVAKCGNTSIYGGTYEGNWINYPACHDSYTKVYGKELFVKDNHLVGTLCDGNKIDVYIFSGYSGLEPSTVNIENNCTSFPQFDECGGKGGKSGKKTKSSLFRP